MFSLKSKIVIIGAGKISYSLVNALVKSGLDVAAIISKEKTSAKKLAQKFKIQHYSDNFLLIPSGCEIYLLAVPDEAIKEISVKLSKQNLDFKNSIFIHLSGSEDISNLENLKNKKAATASFHIMQSFPSKKIVDIKNCYAAVETIDKKSEKLLFDIAEKIKLHPFRITSENKVYYHIAGVFASNFLVANSFIAKEIFEKTNSRVQFEKVFEPITDSTLDNIKNTGVLKSISGPVERGDLNTVKNHLEALKGNYLLRQNYINQSLILLELIKNRNGQLKTDHKKLKKMLEEYSG